MTRKVPMSFETLPYELVHGSSPRGRGVWAFCPFHLRNDPERAKLTVTSPELSFTQAKIWAKTQTALQPFGLIAVMP